MPIATQDRPINDLADFRQVAGPLSAHDSVEPGQFDVQDLLAEKQQRGQSLVLRGGRHLAIDRQVREERLDLCRGHVGRMAHAVEQDEAPRPQQRYCCSVR